MAECADEYFNYYVASGNRWTTDFQDVLWNTTMLKSFYYHVFGAQYETARRRQTLLTLEHLRQMPSEKGPKFVFAYLFCPHAEYLFGADGGYVAQKNWNNCQDKRFYLEQHAFIAGEVEKVVDSLLEKSETPPVIILQSDHGQRPHHPGIDVGPEEWRKILNAMYLPGLDTTQLSESMSPVNAFRLVFNRYFGADYPLVQDD